MSTGSGRAGHPWTGALVAALPCFWLSWKFREVLRNPLAEANRQWAIDAGLLVPVEFLLMHAGMFAAFIAMTKNLVARIAVAAFLSVIYLALLSGFLGARPSWILLAALLLLATRIGGAVVRGGGAIPDIAFAFLALVLYIGLFATMTGQGGFGQPFPPEVVAALKAQAGRVGWWIDQPHLPVRALMLWFLALGLIELLKGFTAPRPARTGADAPDVALEGRRLELRFARGEMELREKEGLLQVLLPLCVFGGVFFLFGFLLYGKWPLLAVLLFAGGILACGKTLLGVGVLRLRARAGVLELDERSSFGSKPRRRLDLEAASAMYVEAVIITNDEPTGFALRLQVKEGIVEFAWGLPERRQAEALRRLLLAFVEHGSADKVWQALQGDRDVAQLLEERAAELLASPRAALAPLPLR